MRFVIVALVLVAGSVVATLGGTAVDDGAFSDLLGEYVADGRVDYAALCKDDRLDVYTRYLSAIDPESLPSDADKLAFWINAYNAFTLKLICDNYPVKSINDLHTGGRIVGHVIKKTAWDKKFIEINGKELTLNNIEHDIIREHFDDPRIHFALVCAAKSCPPLRSEAFAADRLDEQLDDQGRVFFAQTDKNRVDADKKTVYLSKILDWYEGDFGDGKKDVLAYIARYLPGDVAEDIRANPGDWQVKYTDYDWALND